MAVKILDILILLKNEELLNKFNRALDCLLAPSSLVIFCSNRKAIDPMPLS
jgi:hypothetical protein